MIDREILAYLAGLFDGEGCIRINKSYHSPRGNRFRRYQYQIQCTVSNTNPTAVRLFEKYFSGSVHVHSLGSENHKTTWTWSVGALKATKFLKKTIPFLRLKKDEAKLALKFRKTVFSRGEWNNHNLIITDSHDQERQSYKDDLELLRKQRFLI